MFRRTLAGSLVAAAIATFGAAPAVAAPEFPQCPAVGEDTGCQFLITITDSGATVQQDASQGPYEGVADSLVGIENDSSRDVQSVQLSAANILFEFDGDGMCNNAHGPAPQGCQPPPGSNATCNPSKVNTNHCSFPPPAGEPPNYTEPGATDYGEESPNNTPVPPPWPNGDLQNGYEGPGVWFSNVAANFHSGVVNFSPPLTPGQSTYFSVEEPNSVVTAVANVQPAGTTTTTRLSGDGLHSTTITVPRGKPVTDRAFIAGQRAANASGSVNYTFFKDKGCTHPAAPSSSAAVSKDSAGASKPVKLAPGTYYARATYNGDAVNSPSVSACGAEVLIVARRFNAGLPSNDVCVAHRTLIFRIQKPRSLKASNALIEINGKLFRKTRFGKLVIIHKLPKGRFHIEVITVNRHGVTYEQSRAYRTCGK
jgi:hypothetical protein